MSITDSQIPRIGPLLRLAWQEKPRVLLVSVLSSASVMAASFLALFLMFDHRYDPMNNVMLSGIAHTICLIPPVLLCRRPARLAALVSLFSASFPFWGYSLVMNGAFGGMFISRSLAASNFENTLATVGGILLPSVVWSLAMAWLFQLRRAIPITVGIGLLTSLVAILFERHVPDEMALIHIGIPSWQLLMSPTVIYLGLAALWADEHSEDQIEAISYCPTCGYDLTGLRSDICPECGTAVQDG